MRARRPRLAALCCAVLGLLGGPVFAGGLGPALQAVVEEAAPTRRVPVLIRFDDRLDLKALRAEVRRQVRELFPEGLPGVHRHKRVERQRRVLKRRMLIQGLERRTRRARHLIRHFLRSRGEEVRLRALWTINAVAGRVPVALIDEIAALPGVQAVNLDVRLQGPVSAQAPAAPVSWNIDLTGAPVLWDSGATGEGVVVATMDSGVDLQHPDLAGSYRGGGNSWFDPYGQQPVPADLNGHGTQVMGIIVGGDASGLQRIGMAPDAQWIAARIFDNANHATLSAIHRAFQWLLDPDGDPATDDAPDVVNNSWALETTINECNREFAPDIALLKEAGIAVIFSAGNFGSSPETSVSPANDPAVLAVGAVDVGLNVIRASSRGPGACDGGIYPQVVAPGDGVFTTDRMDVGGYNIVSGTSFAVAHLAGGMALLRGAFPRADVTQIEDAILQTANGQGLPGPDDEQGYGVIDILAASNWLADTLGQGGPGRLQFSAATYSIDENVARLTVNVTRSGGSEGEVAVRYQSGDGSALAGEDYVAASGTLTFGAGEVRKTFTVAILDDARFEGNETFELSLADPTAGAELGARDRATVTVLENDPPPNPGRMAIDSAAHAIAEDAGQLEVAVLRLDGSQGRVTVDYALGGGSATAEVDYAPAGGTLTFLPGETRRTVTVDILDDTQFEGDETVELTLSRPTGGATLDANLATSVVTIVENDPEPVAALASVGGAFGLRNSSQATGRSSRSGGAGRSSSSSGGGRGGGGGSRSGSAKPGKLVVIRISAIDFIVVDAGEPAAPAEVLPTSAPGAPAGPPGETPDTATAPAGPGGEEPPVARHCTAREPAVVGAEPAVAPETGCGDPSRERAGVASAVPPETRPGLGLTASTSAE